MIGIDAHINTVGAKLASKISGLTNLGRAYLVVKEQEGQTLTVPEYNVTGTNQYKTITPNSSLTGQCFFVVQNDYSVTESQITSVDVNIYFAVNLSKLYPTVSERATEYLHRSILNVLKYTKFEVNAITSGYDSFSDFDMVKMGDDLQPYYLCRVNTTIEYNINEC